MLKAVNLTCDYQVNPVGVNDKIQLGWMLESDRRNVLQTSYQLQVAADPNFSQITFDSGVVKSGDSVHIRLDGMNFDSSTRYFYRVKVTDNQGEESPFSETAYFETALLDNSLWKAEFITADTRPEDAALSDGRLLRKTFQIGKKVKSARAYATAMGLYELFLNGKRVGDQVLAPGWTMYTTRTLYQTYDVTGMLREGDNAVAAQVGAGWCKGEIGFEHRRNHYTDKALFICQILVTYEDGSQDLIVTDGSWKWSKGPIVFSEFYDGEIYDARLEQDGYAEPGFDDSAWQPVLVVDQDKKVLTIQDGAPVRKIQEIPAQEMFRTPEGDLVIDFGQNLTGWLRFRVSGKAGDHVLIKYAEILDAKGNFYTENLRKAKCETQYTLSGKGVETFEPHFTFQGYRYIKLAEFPGEPKMEDFTAIVVHSDMKETGAFECSNPLLNQLQHNIKWGMKGNFVDIPTDCPQRDERLGWTGDAQIFVRTASYLMNTYPFFRKWLREVAVDQRPDGSIPHVVPDLLRVHNEDDAIINGDASGATGWGDAAVICPWVLYLTFGDTQILSAQYDSMVKWVDFMYNNAQDGVLWNTGFHFGDWVALDAKEGSYFGATPNDLTATAYYANSVELLAKTATILGKVADAEKYFDLHARIVKAFQDEFFTPTGRMAARTQTAHILALVFHLVPQKFMKRTVDTLLELLKENDGHLVTGFLGTPNFCFALSQNGCTKQAYELLLKEDFPSWLYQVKMGATTVWEHWDGLKPDGTMWSADMNSFNHYAYGAVGEWLYRAVAGLEIDEAQPGYRHTVIHPHIGGGLAYVKASYASIYGDVKVHWEHQRDTVTLKVNVPCNATATVVLDHAADASSAEGVALSKTEDGYTAEIGSGCYTFTYQLTEE